MVNTFCSFILRFLRRHIFDPLDELYNMEGKNLLALQRTCTDLHSRLLKPAWKVANRIEKVLKFFNFQYS